ncbi:hypothetical protein J7E63_23925 [Bacillus sp. ISL-75]|nr:hypothetical protein [Bacillus sp. ISL-75]
MMDKSRWKGGGFVLQKADDGQISLEGLEDLSFRPPIMDKSRWKGGGFVLQTVDDGQISLEGLEICPS